MNRWYPYIAYILILLLIVTLGLGLADCGGRPPFEFPDGAIAAPVLVPQNVFQKHDMASLVFKDRATREGHYTRRKVFVIDLSAGRSFEWQPGRKVSGGILRFDLFLPALVKTGKVEAEGGSPREALVRVLRSGGSGETPVLNMTLVPDRDDFHRSDGYLKQNIEIRLDLDPDDTIRFELRCGYPFETGQKFGMSIPRIFDSNPPNHNGPVPNLILISIDTLRADYVGIYRRLAGEPVSFSDSPNLDQFAEEATVFLHAHSPQSSTWPALSSMLLSLYPNQHGVYDNGDYLNYNFFSLGGFMLNRGYRTVSMHGNAFNLNLSGFEEKYSFFNRDFAQIRFALKKMKDHRTGQPFFHWHHFLGVHANYTPPRWVMDITAGKGEDYRTFNLNRMMKSGKTPSGEDLEYIRKLYAGELYHLDFELAKIFNYLKRHGLWDNTLIIITSDHGEDLYQHNDYFYHYPSIFETSLRVPLMVKFPGQRRQRVIRQRVSLIDIFPTVVHYMNGRNGKGMPQLVGLSLIPLLEGEAAPFEERTLFSGIDRYQIVSTIRQNWKFIFNPREIIPTTQVGTPYPVPRVGLYDLESDPHESRPITEHPMIRRFINAISRFRKWAAEWRAVDLPRADRVGETARKEAEENLRTLGYIH